MINWLPDDHPQLAAYDSILLANFTEDEVAAATQQLVKAHVLGLRKGYSHTRRYRIRPSVTAHLEDTGFPSSLLGETR